MKKYKFEIQAHKIIFVEDENEEIINAKHDAIEFIFERNV